MIPKNMKNRYMVGMEVKTARAIKNSAGKLYPVENTGPIKHSY